MNDEFIVQIEYPHEPGSDNRYAIMMKDLFISSPCEPYKQDILDVLAIAARKAGLKFLSYSDYGSQWIGSTKQFNKAKKLVPVWASIFTIIR